MPLAWLLLLVLIILGAALANRAPVPDALIWCALGFASAFVPGFPPMRLDPRLALFVFLPPLVYSSAVELPWPEYRNNRLPIGMLAIGLVALSTTATAVVIHQVASLPWAMAI